MIEELWFTTFSLLSLYSIWKIFTNKYVKIFGKFLKDCFIVSKNVMIFALYATIAAFAILALVVVKIFVHTLVLDFLSMWYWFETEGYPYIIFGGIIIIGGYGFYQAKKQEEDDERRIRNWKRRQQKQWRKNQYIEYY